MIERTHEGRYDPGYVKWLEAEHDRYREALLYIAHYSYDVMRTPDEELRAIKDYAEKAATRPEDSDG